MNRVVQRYLSIFIVIFLGVGLGAVQSVRAQTVQNSTKPILASPQAAEDQALNSSVSASPLPSESPTLESTEPAPLQSDAPAQPGLSTPMATPAPAEVGEKRASVTYLGEEIFVIFASNSTYSAQERAEIITERIDAFAHQKDPQKIKIHYKNGLAYLAAGELTLMTITEKDADAARLSLNQLAEFYARRLEAAIARGQKHFNLIEWLIQGGLALGLTLVLVLVIWMVNRLFPWFRDKVLGLQKRLLPEIAFGKLTLVNAEQMTGVVTSVLKVLRLLFLLLLLYFYFPLLFSLFPGTRGWSALMFTYFQTPLLKGWKSFTGYIPNLFVIAVIVAVTYYALKLIRIIFYALENEIISYPGFYKDWAGPTYSIVRFLVLAFAVIVIFPYLPGSDSPAFKSVSLFLGVLFSLGSTSAIANVVAGVVLTYMRPFKLGDRVKIADTMGNIVEKTLLVTRIRTIKNVDITIPNSMVLNSHMINYSSSAEQYGLILHTTVTIGYDVPWPKVQALLLEAASRAEFTLAEPKPFVLQTSLDDFYVSYELNVYTNRPNFMAKTYSEIHQHIQDLFHAANIEIMSPHFSAVRDGSQVNIPSEHLPQDYQAPGFKIFPWQNA